MSTFCHFRSWDSLTTTTTRRRDSNCDCDNDGSDCDAARWMATTAQATRRDNDDGWTLHRKDWSHWRRCSQASSSNVRGESFCCATFECGICTGENSLQSKSVHQALVLYRISDGSLLSIEIYCTVEAPLQTAVAHSRSRYESVESFCSLSHTLCLVRKASSSTSSLSNREWRKEGIRMRLPRAAAPSRSLTWRSLSFPLFRVHRSSEQSSEQSSSAGRQAWELSELGVNSRKMWAASCARHIFSSVWNFLGSSLREKVKRKGKKSGEKSRGIERRKLNQINAALYSVEYNCESIDKQLTKLSSYYNNNNNINNPR